MASEHIVVAEGVVFARWHELTAAGVARLQEAANRAAHRGLPPLCIALVGDGAVVEAPSPRLREALLRAAGACRATALVLDGHGLAFAARRAFAADAFAALAGPTGPFHSLGDCLQAICPDDAPALLQVAQVQQVV